MENPSSLANPKKLSPEDFPTVPKRKKEGWWKKYKRQQKRAAEFKRDEKNSKRASIQKTKRKRPGLIKRLKLDFKEYRQERIWRKKQTAKRKSKQNFWAAILLFLLGPILDLRDEIREERAEKKNRKAKFPQSNFFRRSWEDYKETREASRQIKHLDRKVKKSLSFIVEEDKRVFSFREEIEHIRDTWKGLPWNWARELQNMLAVTLVFVLTFSVLYVIFQMAKFGVAAAFSIPGVWRNGMIIFTIPDPSPLWTYSSVISVYSIGPFILLIIGLIFQHLQERESNHGSFKSIFFMWVFLNAYILVFGTFLAGVFTDRGFGYVLGWLYIPWLVEVPLALFSVIMLWLIGFKVGRKFLAFRHSNRFIDTVLSQLYFKLVYFYIPIIVGIGLLFIFGLSDNDFTQNVVYLSILVMLTPTLRFIPERT